MADDCQHIATIQTVRPSALGCEECLKTGSPWVHLRLCRTCGHVGCCDSSPNRHATKHFHATRHPIIEGRLAGRYISRRGDGPEPKPTLRERRVRSADATERPRL